MLFFVIILTIFKLNLFKNSFDFVEILFDLIAKLLYFEVRSDFNNFLFFINNFVSFVSKLRFLMFRSNLKKMLFMNIENNGSFDYIKFNKSSLKSKIIFCFCEILFVTA